MEYKYYKYLAKLQNIIGGSGDGGGGGGSNICNVCKNPASNLCARCNKVYYCSREHQRSDWKDHKHICEQYIRRVVLLSEIHNNTPFCVRNRMIIDPILQEYPESESILLVSEDRDTNECYTNIPGSPYKDVRGVHITEVDSSTPYSNTILLNRLLILLFDIYNAYIVFNNPAGSITMGSDPIVQFIREILQEDHVGELLTRTSSNDKFEELIRIFETDTRANFVKCLIEFFQLIHDNLEVNSDNNILKIRLNTIIQSKLNLDVYKKILTEFMHVRDDILIQKLVTYLETHPRVEVIIILYGSDHYVNLKRLINSKPTVFKFDDKKSKDL
jgi:hypothetical protein